jgi:hypothetical protein
MTVASDSSSGALLVLLDEHHLALAGLQATGQVEADARGAGDHDVLALVLQHAHEIEHVIHVIARDGEVDQVTGADHLLSVRDQPLVPALDRDGEGGRVREQEIHLGDPQAHEIRALVDPESSDVELVLKERHHVDGPRHLEQGRDAVHRGLFRVDADVLDGVCLVDEAEGLGVIGIAQPHHDAGDVEERRRQEAHDHVDLVGVRGRDDEIRLLDSGAAQHRSGGAVALDEPHVEGVAELADLGGIGVDEGDVVTVARELLGEGRAHEPPAHDQDVHAPERNRGGERAQARLFLARASDVAAAAARPRISALR